MMNDKDIIKALECCAQASYPACRACPYHDFYANMGCITKRNSDIENLIKRQQTEIERYSPINKFVIGKILDDKIDFSTQEQEDSYYAYELKKLHSNLKARAEAIKEFAERLKEKGTEQFGHTIVVSENDIDTLAKEMIGKEDE